MKKFLLSIFAVAAMTVPASAQKISVYASYGGYTQMDCTNMHDGWNSVNTAWGSVNLGLDFGIGSRFRIGPSYSVSSTSTAGGSAASHILYNTVMLNAKYDYFRRGIVAVYAHLGLGVEISHLMPKFGDSYDRAYFACQIAPVGARVQLGGGFNFFGELGWGAQGLAQFGFSYDF